MKLTKVQKTTRFIVYSIGILILLSFISGILPTILLVQIYQILGMYKGGRYYVVRRNFWKIKTVQI